MDYAGTYRTLEYEGKMLITCKTTSAVEEGSSQEAQRLWLVAGSLRLELHEERNCLEQVPGVYMLPSDDPSTFFIVAVGSSKEDIDCLPKLHHLLMEACMYKASCHVLSLKPFCSLIVACSSGKQS